MSKKRKVLGIFLAVGLLALNFFYTARSVPVYASTPVANKSKDISKTVTQNITVNDNLLTPDQSILNSDKFSYLSARSGEMVTNTGNVMNVYTGDVTSISDKGIESTMGPLPDGLHPNFPGVYLTKPLKLTSNYGFIQGGKGASFSMNFKGNFSDDVILFQTNAFYVRIADGYLMLDPGYGYYMRCPAPSDWKTQDHRYTLSFTNGDINNSDNSIFVDGVKQSLTPYSFNGGVIEHQSILDTGSTDIIYNAWGNYGDFGTLYAYNRPLTDVEVKNEYNSVANGYYDAMFEDPNTIVKIGNNGIQGLNYLRLLAGKHPNVGDTNAQLILKNLIPNATYTVSAYIKIPVSGTTNGNPLLLPVDKSDGVRLQTISSSGDWYTQTDWKRIWMTFKMDGNTSMILRLDKGDIPEMDVTGLKLEQDDHATPFISFGQSATYDYSQVSELNSLYGISNSISYSENGYLPTTLSTNKVSFEPINSLSHAGESSVLQKHYTQQKSLTGLSSSDPNKFDSSVTINDDGYSGEIPRTDVQWNANWQTNRYSSVQTDSQTSSYYEHLSDWNYPNSVQKAVYDSATGQTVIGSLPLTGTPYSILSATKVFDSYSSGLVQNRNIPGQWITWMSNNSIRYFGGLYYYGAPLPRPFQDYYGPDPDTGTWRLVDYHWGDGRVYSAAEEGESSWISDGDYGGVHANAYARGVYLHYQRTANVNKYKADYSGKIKLPDYISSYDGTANYEGTLSKNQPTSGYNTSTMWKVTITYTGEEHAYDNPPLASFTMNDKIHVGENLNIKNTSSDPDPWDSIASEQWYYENYQSDNYSSQPNSSYVSTTLSALSTFNNTGRYAVRYKVNDIGNPPYSGPLSNESGGSTCWNDVKVYPINTKPTALFDVSGGVKPNQALNYVDKSNPNDTSMGYNNSINDKITAWNWQWKKYSDTTWTNGKPSSFSSEGVYQIRLSVEDNGNYIPAAQDTNNDSFDDRKWSDYAVATVVVSANTLPVNIHADSVNVVGQYDSIPVSQVTNGNTYRIMFTFEDDTDNAINTQFNVNFGFDVMGSDNQQRSSLSPHTPITMYSKPFTLNTSTNIATFDAYANNTGTIIETDADDNALGISLPVTSDTLAAPTAQFTVNSPVMIYASLNYNDTSHVNQAGAYITERNWQWSTDNMHWNLGQPGSFDLSQFPTNVSNGTYYIKEQVKDSNGLYSLWSTKTVTVYRYNTKPATSFTVSSPVLTGQTLNYNFNDNANDAWDSIKSRNVQWSTDNINWNNGQPTSFDLSQFPANVSNGTYYIREQVQDTGNILSGPLWSDWYTRTVTVYRYNTKPTASFTVSSPVLTGQTLNYNFNDNANDAWDSIKSRNVQWSTDNINWNNGQPTSFDLSQFPANVSNGTYYIREQVQDTGNLLSPALWSDWYTRTVTVYRYNTKPTASFAVSSPVLTGQTLNYTEISSANDAWDSIKARSWQWSTDNVNWNNGKPTSFDLSQFPANVSNGTYYIREQVQDTGNILSGPLWSDWCTRTVTVYRYNTKPTASFTVSNPVLTGQTLSYNDTSNANDAWDSIKTRNWQWSTDNVNWNNGQPTSFDLSQFPANVSNGTYYIREQVQDTGNLLSPALWSDWYTQTVTVYRYNTKPTTSFTVSSPVLTGQTLNYNFNDNANDAWDSIKSRNVQWSTDNVNWNNWQPTSFDLSQFPANVSNGTYYIRERVQDTGNLLSPALWSDWYTRTVTVYRYNTKPTASFTVSSPVLTGQTLSYNDTSNANDAWDSIKTRNWQWSTDNVNWNNGKPTSFDLSQFPANVSNGTYYIREQVQDTGDLLSPALWSDWYTRTVTVYRYNTKPTAAFTVNPNPQFINYPLAYTDYSTANDLWDALTQYEWSYSANNGLTWSNVSSTPPNSFPTPGDYKVRLRVKDTGDLLSPALWSDYCIVNITIKDVFVVGQVNHTDIWNQNRINYNKSKTGDEDSPRGYNVFFPGENFILNANTTIGANAESVQVTIPGTSFSTYLNKGDNDTWSGSLWDQSMIDWPDGIVKFTFTAKYPYGVVKTNDVYIQIENDGGYWRQHREF